MLSTKSRQGILYVGQLLSLLAYAFIAWPNEKFGTVLMYQIILFSPLAVYDTGSLLLCLLSFSGPTLLLTNMIWQGSFKRSVVLMRISLLLMAGQLIRYHLFLLEGFDYDQVWYFIPEIVFLILAGGMLVVCRNPRNSGV